ncbi:hypothetical protein HQ399_07320 [Aeromonas jandaei]|uniref:Site-specific integrase n=1 Tax=Aeromonas jandaei TaxID=650 RepID=A0ABD7ELI8_AERJA|nr:hypothetical protein [Aeromonas jandaei]QWL62070.1 hypothetical protein HQ399_07320 [Aeromonas jandaei]
MKLSTRAVFIVSSKRIEAIYTHLGTHLSDEIILWLKTFNGTASNEYANRLLRVMLVSVTGYGDALNSKNTIHINEFIELYCVIASHKYNFRVANNYILALKKFILFMKKNEAFSGQPLNELESTLERTITEDIFQNYRAQSLPSHQLERFNFDIKLPSSTDGKIYPGLPTHLETIRPHLNHDIYDLISLFLYSCNLPHQQVLSINLARYIIPLKSIFNERNLSELTETLSYIIAHTTTYTKSLQVFNLLLFTYSNLFKYLVDSNYFQGNIISAITPILKKKDEAQYALCKSKVLPSSFLSQATKKQGSDDEFNDILSSTCPPDIAQRVKEHVNSFKIVKHHREPIGAFLKHISSISSKWYQQPNLIQGELSTFRGDLLNRLQRNTAYMKFQHVKNCISVLIKHGLLPNSIDLPNNLRRDTNTEKIRDDNPIISKTNIYEEDLLEHVIDSKSFLEQIEKEIKNNIQALLSYAKNIVYESYKKFCDAPSLIAISNYGKETQSNTQSARAKNNSFSQHNALRLENTVAYFTQNYHKLIQGTKGNETNEVILQEDALQYLGLTIITASAMQIIITEELGINPYSLYTMKAFATSYGVEFMQVDDDGSVRVRTIKPRARYARTRKAIGDLTPIAKVKAQDIDASICLKMAMEMTENARNVALDHNLWLCMTIRGISKCKADDFQRGFKQIRNHVTSESNIDVINDATLKKVRVSKGILIYLQSHGDALRTATYFGNTVKTTLNRYIPKYLTELIYRVKIRSFQRILLFMAIANNASPFESAHLSESKFKAQLASAFSNPEMGGELFNSLTVKPSNDEREQSVYFCVSEKNLKLAIVYAKEGEDEHLKKLCSDVINMVSTSNTPLKIMLRNAHKSIEQESS